MRQRGPVARFKVVIADQPGADHEVEAAALAASGLTLEPVWLDARDADRVLEHAADADALVMSWVPSGSVSQIDPPARGRVHLTECGIERSTAPMSAAS